MLSFSGQAVLACNRQGVVTNYNEAAQALFGYPSAEVVGKNISLLMPENVGRRHNEYIAKYLSTKAKVRRPKFV